MTTNLAIVMSPEVQLFLGVAAVTQFAAGEGLPAAVQCWVCGGGIRVAGGRPGTVSLSMTAHNTPNGGRLTLTVWSHVGCAPSRLVTFDELAALPAAHIPSPVPDEGTTVMVEPTDDDPMPDLVTPECPTCDEPPAMVLGGGTQAFCGNDSCDTWTWNAMLTRAQLADVEVGEIDISGLVGLGLEDRGVTGGPTS